MFKILVVNVEQMTGLSIYEFGFVMVVAACGFYLSALRTRGAIRRAKVMLKNNSSSSIQR